VANVVDDRFKTMQLNISGVKAFSAHPTSISRYLAADLGNPQAWITGMLSKH
jgi:hypothetical protein